MAMVNQGLRLSDLQAGQRVKIHGMPGQDGTLVACSISMKAPDTTAVIEGPIEDLDYHKRTLRILGLDLRVPSNAEIQDISRSRVALTALEIGDIAKLKGTCQPSHGFVLASIKLQPAESALLAEVQGCIDSVDPPSGTLRALGFTVVVNDETAINDFPSSDDRRTSAPPATTPDDLARSSEPSPWLALEGDDERTAVAVDLEEYLRMPAPGGARLTRAEADTTATTSSAGLNDPVESLIDGLNADVLAGLARTAPGPAYLLAFVSGSPVRNRLQGTRSSWHRLLECLNLDAVTRDLARSFDAMAIEGLIGKLRRSTEARLLVAGSRLGPAKLLFRRRGMDEILLTGASYNAIERLVAEMALLSSDCDEDTLALLREGDLGKSAPAVRRRLHFLLRRFHIDESPGSSDRAFDDFVQMQREAGCLHPALPIPTDIINRTAGILGMSHVLAKQAITLFRFAWLCGQDRAEGVSDFAVKGLIAIAHGTGAQDDALEGAENVLNRTYETMLKVMGEHADLSRFRKKYPDVRVEVAAQVVAMPQPLFDVFSSLDGPGERRLDFLTRYRLGAEQFASYVAEQHERMTSGSLGLSDGASPGELVRDLPSLFDAVVFLSAKEGKKRAKRGRVTPLTVSPMMLRASLERMLSTHDDADVSEWSWRLNEVAKCDLVGRIRGVWSVKGR